MDTNNTIQKEDKTEIFDKNNNAKVLESADRIILSAADSNNRSMVRKSSAAPETDFLEQNTNRRPNSEIFEAIFPENLASRTSSRGTGDFESYRWRHIHDLATQ